MRLVVHCWGVLGRYTKSKHRTAVDLLRRIAAAAVVVVEDAFQHSSMRHKLGGRKQSVSGMWDRPGIGITITPHE